MRILALILWLLPTLALAEDWKVLNQPGVFAIMRHALAPGTGDPSGFDVNDCTTQRNLDDRGRAQARAIGQAMRDRGLEFEKVLTSQWCRCRETAELLGLGTPRPDPALNSFFADRSTAAAQTDATRALIAALPGRTLLVTHQVNISALTGRGTRSGEVLAVRLTETGAEVLGSFLIAP